MTRKRVVRSILAVAAGLLLFAGGRLWRNRPDTPLGMTPLMKAGVVGGGAAQAGGEQEILLHRDVVFGKGCDEDLRLDLAMPASGEGPFPLVVCIHGGAWCSGSRSDYFGAIQNLARHGYAAASVDYRLAPESRFPAQVEDVKCAVRYLRAHAAELRIDPRRVGALGDSAGGHLALLLGLMDAKDGLEGSGGCPDQPSKVQAVADYFGPADFTRWTLSPLVEPFVARTLGKSSRQIVSDFLGARDAHDPVLARASPAHYVGRGDPPVLIFHGTLDMLVPLRQSEMLRDALKKAGVPCTLVPMPGLMHGWGGPRKEETDRQTIEFFDRWLKNRPAGAAEN